MQVEPEENRCFSTSQVVLLESLRVCSRGPWKRDRPGQDTEVRLWPWGAVSVKSSPFCLWVESVEKCPRRLGRKTFPLKVVPFYHRWKQWQEFSLPRNGRFQQLVELLKLSFSCLAQTSNCSRTLSSHLWLEPQYLFQNHSTSFSPHL